MFNYSYNYKYISFSNNMCNCIIQLTFDNTMGNGVYAAKSNIMFKDENNDWGHACGVADNEDKALLMCINEIYEYLHIINDNKYSLKEVIMPKKIIFNNKNESISAYVLSKENKQIIIIRNNQIILDNDIDIISYIESNIKKYIRKGVNDISIENTKLLEKYTLFENITKEFVL